MTMDLGGSEKPAASSGGANAKLLHLSRLYQTYIDKTVIMPEARWSFCAFVFCAYLLRVYLLDGFYIISYGLGIYLLNLVIGFLSPAIDPDEDEGEGPMLPTMDDAGEFRPFSRKLPEFKFWYTATKSIVIGIICTFFPVLDLPVFWPILLMYFLLLVFITMKERVKHMIKYKYVPWSAGKQTYKDMTKIELGKMPQGNGIGSAKGK